MTRLLVGASLVILIGVVGCGGPAAGDPVPGSPLSGPDSSASPSGRADTGINMTGFDPCVAITKDQAASLGVDGPKSSTSSQGTRSCTWSHYRSEPIESYYVDSSDSAGIEQVNAVGDQFMIGRYKAVFARSRTADFETVCQIAIGVRPGQILQVNYGYEGSTQRMTHDQACQKAKPVAEMVIANLDRGGN